MLLRPSELAALDRALSINLDLQASLAFLFRPRFADPHHAARHRIRGILVQNEFDKLSSFKAGGPSYLESTLRVVEDETWNPLRLPSMRDDQTGPLFQGRSFQSSALGNGSAEHSSLSTFLDINAESARPQVEVTTQVRFSTYLRLRLPVQPVDATLLIARINIKGRPTMF